MSYNIYRDVYRFVWLRDSTRLSESAPTKHTALWYLQSLGSSKSRTPLTLPIGATFYVCRGHGISTSSMVKVKTAWLINNVSCSEYGGIALTRL